MEQGVQWLAIADSRPAKPEPLPCFGTGDQLGILSGLRREWVDGGGNGRGINLSFLLFAILVSLKGLRQAFWDEVSQIYIFFPSQIVATK